MIVDTLRRAGCVFAEEEAAILLESVGNGAGTGDGAVSSGSTGSGTVVGPCDRVDSVLRDRVARRVAGEPLEQIVGWVDFAGLRLRTLPGVFVPRQRTRLLAEHTVRVIEQMLRPQPVDVRPGAPDTQLPTTSRTTGSAAPVVVEAFCGVGPVGSYVAASLAEVHLHLGDTDAHAVECAVDNARTVAGGVPNASDDLPAAASTGHPTSSRSPDAAGVVVSGHRLDCLVGLPDELRHGVDVITAVPPYVPTTAADFLPREAVDFEPSTALFGGTDGLDLVRRLIAEADHWLATDGVLLIELGREQAADALTYASARGLVGTGRLGEGDEDLDWADDGPDGHLGEGDDHPGGHTVVLELRRAR
ncbi:N5-glutamine methyltransferase family protein [Brevibacterium atlanticum]|uniref:N5-glutamine methyltransferase family protein n=1 Tax=Brevibacterium atlanticum TaxID=2697563 RepID=UPI001AA0E95E|nr:hypothetical protein [Brevibacterium atlanticum]